MQDSKYIVEGGQRLEGTITIQSAKNAISKQLVASVLTNEPCILENIHVRRCKLNDRAVVQDRDRCVGSKAERVLGIRRKQPHLKRL